MTMRFQQVDVSMTSNHLELSDKFMQVVSGANIICIIELAE